MSKRWVLSARRIYCTLVDKRGIHSGSVLWGDRLIKLVKTANYKETKVFILENELQTDTDRNGFASKQSTHFTLKKVFNFLSFLSFGKKPCSLPKMDTKPPDTVRGMKQLDKDAFSRKAQIPALKVPIKGIGRLTCTGTFKKSLLKLVGVRPIADLADCDPNQKEFKMFLFDPTKYTDVGCFTDHEKEALQKAGVDIESWQKLEIDLTYENWTHKEILKAVLPEDSDGVAGFSSIGHIVHLNLRDGLQEYKHIIGKGVKGQIRKG